MTRSCTSWINLTVHCSMVSNCDSSSRRFYLLIWDHVVLTILLFNSSEIFLAMTGEKTQKTVWKQSLDKWNLENNSGIQQQNRNLCFLYLLNGLWFSVSNLSMKYFQRILSHVDETLINILWLKCEPFKLIFNRQTWQKRKPNSQLIETLELQDYFLSPPAVMIFYRYLTHNCRQSQIYRISEKNHL